MIFSYDFLIHIFLDLFPGVEKLLKSLISDFFNHDLSGFVHNPSKLC